MYTRRSRQQTARFLRAWNDGRIVSSLQFSTFSTVLCLWNGCLGKEKGKIEDERESFLFLCEEGRERDEKRRGEKRERDGCIQSAWLFFILHATTNSSAWDDEKRERRTPRCAKEKERKKLSRLSSLVRDDNSLFFLIASLLWASASFMHVHSFQSQVFFSGLRVTLPITPSSSSSRESHTRNSESFFSSFAPFPLFLCLRNWWEKRQKKALLSWDFWEKPERQTPSSSSSPAFIGVFSLSLSSPLRSFFVFFFFFFLVLSLASLLSPSPPLLRELDLSRVCSYRQEEQLSLLCFFFASRGSKEEEEEGRQAASALLLFGLWKRLFCISP